MAVLAGVSALALVAAAVLVVLRLQTSPRHAQTRVDASSSSAPCSGPVLRVMVASTYAPVLRAAQHQLASGSNCVQLRIDAADGRQAAERLAGADVWIPDDAAWVGDAESELAEQGVAGSGATLAVTPLYMAAGDANTAARIQRAGATWYAVARLVSEGSGVRLAVRDPQGSGEGLLGLGDLARAIWDRKGMDESALALNETFHHTRTVPGTGRAWPRPGEVGIVAETSVLADPRSAAPLTLFSGRDRTALLRYTWLPTRAAVADPARAARLKSLFTVLRGTGSTADSGVDSARRAAGLRAPDRSPVGGGARSDVLSAPPFDVLPKHNVYHVFASWYPAFRRASVLIVVDVSGSMAAAAPGSTKSLIDLVRSGCRTTEGLLPVDASLGLWKFGSNLQPTRGLDYVPLTGLAILSGRHRRDFAAAVDRLQAQPTGTGLYDTILAAYRFAVAHYRAGIPNTIMVVTDGRNEDDPNSISLTALNRALASAKSAKRPIQLTIAALGDEPDADALSSVVDPLGGRVAHVSTAGELGALFVHMAAGAG